MNPIPMFDLRAQHQSIREELQSAVERVVSSCGFIGGPEVDQFAAEFAAYCGVKHAIPCSDGTEALRLAIVGVLGEGNGESEIITVSHTFAATVEAIEAARYHPVLVDVDSNTYLMDVEQVKAVCTPRTVAVVPVHLYGRMLDVRRLKTWASGRGLAVIEDAAQAHGAAFGKTKPGQCSDAASFSFYPGKNIGAWGDAGAVICNDGRAARRMEQLVDHGRSDKFTHVRIGLNGRMDALQAAILRVKLRHLDAWNEARRRVASWYDESFAGAETVVSPSHRTPRTHERPSEVRPDSGTDSDAHFVYHQYVIQVKDRSAVRKALDQVGIGTGIHYPIPVHEQPAYRYLGYAPTDLPVTHALCGRILSLPMYPELTRGDVGRIASVVLAASEQSAQEPALAACAV